MFTMIYLILRRLKYYYMVKTIIFYENLKFNKQTYCLWSMQDKFITTWACSD